MVILFRSAMVVLGFSALIWQIVAITTHNGGNFGSLILFGVSTSLAISQLLRANKPDNADTTN